MSQSSPELYRPDLSVRLITALLDQLTATHGEELITACVEEVGVELDYLRDPDNWISSTFSERFVKTLVKRLYGEDGFPGYQHPIWQQWYLAGRRSLEPRFVGAAWHVLRNFGSPAMFYRTVPRSIRLTNNTTEAEWLGLGRGHCRIVTTPRPGFQDQPGNCWSRRGVLQAGPTAWGLPAAELAHPQCIHDPDNPADSCVYELRFQSRSPWKPFALPLIASLGFFVAWGLPDSSLITGSLGALVALGAEGWRRNFQLRASGRDSAADLDTALLKADRRYRELWEDRKDLHRSLLTNQKISGYLAESLVEEIVNNPELELTLGGRRTDATVLFADIVSFTNRCEGEAPEVIVETLNTWFGHVDPVIRGHGGIIDKRIGDGIMAVFTDKAGSVPHAQRGVGCGLEMLRALQRCNLELRARGVEPFQIRVGVASGTLVQGNMGSDVKLEYTVIGDIVNTAARLESAAPHGAVLTLRQNLPRPLPPGVVVLEERQITVKGKEETLDVVALGWEEDNEGEDSGEDDNQDTA